MKFIEIKLMIPENTKAISLTAIFDQTDKFQMGSTIITTEELFPGNRVVIEQEGEA